MSRFPQKKHIDFLEDNLVIDLIPDDRLGNELERVNYSACYWDIQIVPGRMTFEGCPWQLEEPSHVIYGKRRNPKMAVGIPAARFKHVETGKIGLISLDSPELDYRKRD